MVSSYPFVTIITINYNQTIITRELLASLRNISYPSFEIIVVDNGSKDESIKKLKDEFPEIILIQTGKNLGFAGGNNVGLKIGKGDYFLLINNDVEVTPDFLEPLVQTLVTNPTIGIASPKIIYYHNKLIQYAGATNINPFTGRGNKIGNLQIDKGQYDFVQKTELGHGACLFISRNVLKSVGFLPEEYFLYYEEHDFTQQAKSKGFEVYYVGTSKVFHKESISIGKNTPLKTFYQSRNRILYLKRNSSYFSFKISFLFLFLFAIPKQIILFLYQIDFVNLKAYVKGILSYLNHSKYNDSI